MLLTRLGCDAYTAACGEEAIASFEKAIKEGKPYQAVILDLTVQTGMGGLEALKKMRTLDPKIYAVMASGASVDNMSSSYQAQGFSALLPKPFNIQDLTDCIQKIKATRA